MSNDSYHPLGDPKDDPNPKVSTTVYCIAGIKTTVYGLIELPNGVSDVACLWLLHPRLATEERMAPMAAKAITHWNKIRSATDKGLIAVSFDQRNHGRRMVDPLGNKSWREGNTRHAQDMFSIYQGTAQDTSLLITHLPSYLPDQLSPSLHLVLGVSLGAHSAWHCVLHDDRIRAACIIIGCPDYARLMARRAARSKIDDWKSTSTPGEKFFGSLSFPVALVDTLNAVDPAGLLLPASAKATNLAPLAPAPDGSLVPQHKEEASKLLNQTIGGKAIMNLAGGIDKLVPHACGQTFYKYLLEAKEGFWKKEGESTFFHDQIFEGIGHAVSPEMSDVAVNFISDVVSGNIAVQQGPKSRI
jgi:hypothetical protein